MRLQLLTGMRPGELCNLTPGEVDGPADVWNYRPEQHKAAHRGHKRVVAIGPQAQGILAKYRLRADDASCFSPEETCRQYHENRSRSTPTSCGNRRSPERLAKAVAKLNDRYTVIGFRQTIRRARWRPSLELQPTSAYSSNLGPRDSLS